MLEAPSIISVPEQSAAIIRITVPRSDMQSVMPPAIKELRTVLAAQGITPAGGVVHGSVQATLVA